ncbi:MAG: hypothetical protein PHF00_10165, partial [Elusimicrobia bacterium]|nr:hypothetical protein [Elusimicrobiota bacterium]
MRRPFPEPSPLMIAALLSAASAAILRAAPAQYFGRQHDDALYVIASHALASGGYRNLICPGLPPLTMIMPGFPALLLPVTWLWGERFIAYQLFCAAIAASLPWLLWRWLRRRTGAAAALLVALAFAFNPIVLSQSGTVMSESAYAALTILLLAALEARRQAAAGGLLLALTQLRPAGFSLLPAVLAGALRRRDWRAAGLRALPAALAGAAWYAWSWSVSGRIDEFHELSFSYAGKP